MRNFAHMKKLFCYLRFITFVIVFTSCIRAYSSEREKIIKFGLAEVTLRVEGVPIHGGHAFVETCPIFSGINETVSTPLEQTSEGMFYGTVQLEQAEEIVGIIFEDENINIGFMAEVSQTNPTVLTLTLSSDGQFENLQTNQTDKLSPIELTTQLSRAWWAFLENAKYKVAPDSLYADWHKVREYELEIILPGSFAAIEEEVGTIEMPTWFINSLKMRFASLNYTPYTAIAERENAMSVQEPPLEAYCWLDSLDYSAEMLKHLPYVGLKPFMSTLIRFPGGGLNPIGEMPTHQWEKYAAETLKPVITEPSSLLLNLLSAMSYILQIENEKKPLSNIQLSNLKHAYSDDLGKIVEQYNNQLVKNFQVTAPTDYSYHDFNLKQYIDTVFPNQPVIVDFWNTWCSPCLSAIQRVSAIKEQLPEGIAYLYISDTSSDYKAWQNMADKIPGVNIRIRKEVSLEIGTELGFSGFPSYIFYNSRHDIFEKMTGFPGLNDYIKFATDIVNL